MQYVLRVINALHCFVIEKESLLSLTSRHILTLPVGKETTGNDLVGIIGLITEPLEGYKLESWLATALVKSKYAR